MTWTRAMPGASSRRAGLTTAVAFLEDMRNSLVVIVQAAVLAAACGGGQGSSPVSPADCQATAPHRAGTVLAVDVDPSDSTIRGLLPDGPTATVGRPFQVQWVMDARKAGPRMRMRAIRQGTSQVVDLSWSGRTSGQLAEFPARITFPASGCWAADLSSGTGGGEVVLRVNKGVPPPRPLSLLS